MEWGNVREKGKAPSSGGVFLVDNDYTIICYCDPGFVFGVLVITFDLGDAGEVLRINRIRPKSVTTRRIINSHRFLFASCRTHT